jgi:hypothetical protein
MSEPIAKDMEAAPPQAQTLAQAEINGINHEDASKGAIPHTFDPDMSPAEKAAAAGKGRDELKSLGIQEKKEEARGMSIYFVLNAR